MASYLSAPVFSQALPLIRPVARHGDSALSNTLLPQHSMTRSRPDGEAAKPSARMGMGDAAEIAQLARRYQSAALSAARSAAQPISRK